MSAPSAIKLKLPATSANLGPGFDAAALAMTLYLEVEAQSAEAFCMQATGRNADVCGAIEGNLLIDTYTDVLRKQGKEITPLALVVRNGIPLGMGCGSSAAVILAGIALAAHFGELGWTREQVLEEACAREGHPDNAAACWLGGMVVAAMENGKVYAASLKPRPAWKLMLALPNVPLATKKARALLPESYSKADTIANVQRVALLTAAFAQGDGSLLRVAMQDRMHQPYRQEVCSLLPRLLPLAGRDGVLGVALSGAGSAMLLVLDEDASEDAVRQMIADRTKDIDGVEILVCAMETQPAQWGKSMPSPVA
ncbi:MAG: homoserine kinase [Acidobacteriaceae bacterium]